MKSVSKLNDEIFIGLGANLGSPTQTFRLALALIERFAQINSVSKLYKSAPFGYSDQPPFNNAVASLSTSLDPNQLLIRLQQVEGALGKEVIHENGPRLIDLDLLLYQDQVMESKELTLPHPGVLSRDFVLLPLLEINPLLSHPSWGGKTLKSALQEIDWKYVQDDPEDWNHQI